MAILYVQCFKDFYLAKLLHRRKNLWMRIWVRVFYSHSRSQKRSLLVWEERGHERHPSSLPSIRLFGRPSFPPPLLIIIALFFSPQPLLLLLFGGVWGWPNTHLSFLFPFEIPFRLNIYFPRASRTQERRTKKMLEANAKFSLWEPRTMHGTQIFNGYTLKVQEKFALQ